MRQQISERIGELELDRDVIAMLQAMTVADNSAIDPPLWQLGQQFGINHLLVISGSHIVVVAGAGFLLGGLFTRMAPGSGFRSVWGSAGICAATGLSVRSPGGFFNSSSTGPVHARLFCGSQCGGTQK